MAEAVEAARRGRTLGASADRADGSAERVGSRRVKRQEAKFTPLLPISWREGAGGKSRSLVLEVKFKVLDVHAELAVSQQLDVWVWRAQERFGLQITYLRCLDV